MGEFRFSPIGRTLPEIDDEPRRIYVILDSTHRFDDLCVSKNVVYVGTDLKKAVEHFNRFYNNPSAKEDEDYVYEYELMEYTDEYSPFTDGTAKRIAHVNTVEE